MRKRLLLLSLCFLLIICSKVLANDYSNSFKKVISNDVGQSSFIVNYSPYVESIHTELKGNWFPSKHRKDVVITFKITKDGKYKNLKILEPSTNKKDNQAAIDAVMFASPFVPLPDSVNELTLKYTFPGQKTVTKIDKNAIKIVSAH